MVRRAWLGVVVVAVTVGVAVAAVLLSRGGEAKRTPYAPPAASKQFGDDADLMRRLERKKLVQHEVQKP